MPSSICAVLLRCHFRSDDVDSAVMRLRENASSDFFILKDSTSNRDTFAHSCLEFNCHSFESLGLSTFGNSQWAWAMGDYPLYIAASRLPNYSHFVMIDYDVHVNFGLPAFIQECLAGEYHFVAGYAGFRNPDWRWSEYAAEWFDDVRGSFFPIVFVSRELLNRTLAFRQMVTEVFIGRLSCGEVVQDVFRYMLNCEAVIPSVARKYCLKIADISAAVPGWSYEYFNDVDFIPAEYFRTDPFKAVHPLLPFSSLAGKLVTAAEGGLPHGSVMAERFKRLVTLGVLDPGIDEVRELLEYVMRKFPVRYVTGSADS